MCGLRAAWCWLGRRRVGGNGAGRGYGVWPWRLRGGSGDNQQHEDQRLVGAARVRGPDWRQLLRRDRLPPTDADPTRSSPAGATPFDAERVTRDFIPRDGRYDLSFRCDVLRWWRRQGRSTLVDAQRRTDCDAVP